MFEHKGVLGVFDPVSPSTVLEVELAELVEDITECAVNGEFELSESLIDLFRKIPQTVHDMMGSDSDATEKADEIKLKFSNILELLTHPVGPEDAEEEEAASGDIEDKNGAGDGKGRPEDIQKGNGKSKPPWHG